MKPLIIYSNAFGFPKKKSGNTCLYNAILATFFLLINLQGFSQSWYNTGWSYRKIITIDYTKVGSGTHSDYPVLIKVTDAQLSANALASGNDILFTLADGITKLSYDRELFDKTTGELVAWVKIPSLISTANTSIYMYYGNGTATDQADATNVYDANYEGVWHMNDATNQSDATNNNRTGTNTGSVQTDALAAKGRDFEETRDSDKIDVGTWNVPATTGLTLQCWVKFEGIRDADDPRLISKALNSSTDQNHTYMLSVIDPSNIRFRLKTGTSDASGTTTLIQTGGSTLTLGAWHFCVATYDGANMRLYRNGVQVASVAKTGNIRQNAWSIFFGNSPGSPAMPLDGILDEVRISSVARSAGWLMTEYNNQNNPSTFHTVGSEECYQVLPPTSNAGTNATCTSFSANWSASNNATAYLLDVSTSNSFATFVTGYNSRNVGSLLTVSVTGLAAGTTYYYRVRASNSCGPSTNSATRSFSTSPATPATPGTITGNASQCPAVTGQVYSISSVANATSYTWAIPTGWTITAGQNTRFVTVTSGSAGQNGNISVTAGNSCGTSTARTVAVTVIANPVITGTTPGSRCGTGTVNLSAAASAGVINWYAAATGGTSLGTGTSFTSPSISSTTIYYADATANGCTSTSRTAVTATVNVIPTITGSTPASRCGTGTVVLAATASAGVINWYAAATGGTSLGTGTSFTTPSISSTTTYYADATANGCTSASRTAVTATVNAIPTITGATPTSRCGTGTVVLAATASAGIINWYAAATGGTSLGTGTSFTTPSIGSTTIYYADATATGCTSASRTAVTATVNAIPTITGSTPASRCGTGTVVLAATASAGIINWYAAATGGTSLGTGTSFTTPSISSTTIYYADATANGCTSASRTAVTATVNAIPTITGSTPASRCGTGTVVLAATASAGVINWYAAATGGTSLGTGTSFTTPSIGSTTIYYADATATGCTSASRTAVTATVNAIPTITGSTPASRCGTGTVVLAATASAGIINWYAAATGGTLLGTGTSFTTPSIGSTTIYYADATANGCTSASRTAVTATVNPMPAATISYAGSPYCSGSGNANVILTGTPGGTFSSTAGLILDASTGALTISSSSLGTYTVTYAVAASGGCSSYETTTTISIVTSGTWTGADNNSWENGANWLCGDVPNSLTNVTIATGLAKYPLMYGITGAVKNLTIQTGATLTIDGALLKVAGSITNDGSINANKGGMEFNGTTSQVIPVKFVTGKTIKQLVINNAAGVSMLSELSITEFLAVNQGLLNTDGLLTLKSTANGTARIEPLPVDGSGTATAYINGNVTIERYLPARKAWRLLSAPVKSTSAPSINSAWQEGVTTSSTNKNPSPGYGVYIQGGTVANGFDQGATSTPSIKYYNNTVNNFLALPTSPGTNIPITNYPGYFLYVRGDRGINLQAGNAAATTSATIKIKGGVNTGSITSAVNATNFTVLGNPFPSPIDFATISKNNVRNAFYVWDPKLSGAFGLGAYVAFSWNEGTSSYDATSSASPLSQYIQSGEAIMIQSADGVNPGTVTIKESDKSANGSDQVFGFYNGPSQQVRANLNSVGTGGSTALLDGVLTTYHDNNSNTIDQGDAVKLNGASESIGIKRGNAMLAIERRATIKARDTTFLNLYQMKIGSYQLEITAQNLDANNTVAVLKDSYSNSINNTLLNPNSTSLIPFSINSDPASYAVGRFSIVFNYEGLVALPVTFKSISAVKKQKDVLVDWAVENEVNVKHYEVERSQDARSFVKINTVNTTAANGANTTYRYNDNSPFNGINYYRIRSVDPDGKTGYSQIAQENITDEQATPAMQIFPNSGTGSLICVRLKNVEKGDYTLSLYNNNGQLLALKTIQYDGMLGTAEGFELNDSFAGGTYTLSLTGNKIKLHTNIMKW